MIYEETFKFKKDLKKLSKKLITLKEDLRVAKENTIEIFHFYKIDNRAVFEIKGAGNNEKIEFYKVKKFACKSLKGRGVRSGIRLIYAYLPKKRKVFLLEIYLKSSNKTNEDRERMEEFGH